MFITPLDIKNRILSKKKDILLFFFYNILKTQEKSVSSRLPTQLPLDIDISDIGGLSENRSPASAMKSGFC